MISVIVCSIDPALLSQLVLNIEQTIGVPFEMLAFDNRETNKSLCAVYNLQGRQAKYNILCFVHEDVLFDTKDWGRKVCYHLSARKTGLIGVAGGDAKSRVPSTWSTVFCSKEMNVIQNDKQAGTAKLLFTSAGNIRHSSTDAACLDGLFLCTRKDVFDEFKFDEERLTGFHGYDIDFSLQVFTKYKVKVVFDILMTHYSSGSVNKSWMQSTLIIAEKWKQHLPLSVYDWSEEERNFYHWKSMQVFLQNLFLLHYPYFKIVRYYLKYSFSGSFSLRRFLSMGKYVVTCMLGKDLQEKKETKPFATTTQLVKQI